MAYTVQLTITSTQKIWRGVKSSDPLDLPLNTKIKQHGNGDTVNNIKSCIQKKDTLIMKVF